MDLKNLALGLTLTASLTAGCGDDAPSTTTATPDAGTPAFVCENAGAPTLYRISSIILPSADDVQNGAPSGHNVDGRDTVCDEPDGVGGVDNAIVTLLDALVEIAPALNVQELVDIALACPSASSDCLDLELIIAVRTGPGCVSGILQDAEGNALSGEYAGTLNASGGFRATTEQLEIAIPFPVEGGDPLEINLDIRSLILTGTIGQSGITDIVIGGVLPRAGFEGTIMPLVDMLPMVPEWDAISPILSGLYDVLDENGACTGLSIGLLAGAEPYTPPVR